MNRSIVLALLLLAACHDKRPPTPSEHEAEQLNDAEDMLNSVDTNAEGPADRSTGPSSNTG